MLKLTSTSQQHFYRLLRYFIPFKKALLLSLFAMVLFSLIDAGQIYLVKPLIDDGLAKNDGSVLKIGSVLVIGIFFFRGLASFVSNYTLSYVSSHVIMQIRQETFNHLLKLPVSFFERHATGELIAKLTYDTEQIANASSRALLIAIRETIIITVLIGIMFYTSWQLSLIFFVIGPVIFGLIRLVSTRFRLLSSHLQGQMGQVTRHIEQTLKAQKEIRAFGTQEKEQARFFTVNNRFRQQAMKLASLTAMTNPVIQLIASFAIAAVLFLASFDSIISELSAGTFTATLVAMGSLLAPLKQISNVNEQLQRGLAAAESIFALLDEPVEKDTGTQQISTLKSITLNQLEFFHLGAEKPALNQITLNIQAGESIALVGESGSGKSTLANLLLRFYDAPRQQIQLNEYPIEQIQLGHLRSLFSLVSQQVILFDDTIAANIAYGCNREVSEKEIYAAAEAAHVLSFAQDFPEGLNTPIGENGGKLSGGQRQRIAIARAFLRDAPILILDEATSALDPISEKLINDALTTLQHGKTTIVIAHRLAAIEDVDRILVLGHGRLLEQGTHASLIDADGAYASLYKNREVAEA